MFCVLLQDSKRLLFGDIQHSVYYIEIGLDLKYILISGAYHLPAVNRHWLTEESPSLMGILVPYFVKVGCYSWYI